MYVCDITKVNEEWRWTVFVLQVRSSANGSLVANKLTFQERVASRDIHILTGCTHERPFCFPFEKVFYIFANKVAQCHQTWGNLPPLNRYGPCKRVFRFPICTWTKCVDAADFLRTIANKMTASKDGRAFWSWWFKKEKRNETCVGPVPSSPVSGKTLRNLNKRHNARFFRLPLRFTCPINAQMNTSDQGSLVERASTRGRYHSTFDVPQLVHLSATPVCAQGTAEMWLDPGSAQQHPRSDVFQWKHLFFYFFFIFPLRGWGGVFPSAFSYPKGR